MRTISFVVGWLVLTSTVFASSFEEILNSFGNLQTVAGRGRFRQRGFNGWEPSMEGGSALDTELSRPHMTMADTQGNLYIADKDAHAIRQVTPDGTIHTIAGTGVGGFNGDGLGVEQQLNQPNGLYTFPNGTTYILDLGSSRIRKLTPDGQLTTVLEDPNSISIGRGLWVSPDESLIYYSSGQVVKKWTADEGITTYASGFASLGNLHVDPTDGNLVVADRSGHSVYRVFPNGSTERIAGNGTTSGGGDGQPALSTGLNEVRGIFFNPGGGYYLATHDGGQVWFVDDHDIIHLLIDGDNDHTHAGDGLPLTSPGKKISEPRAVSLAPNGDLLITESDFGYVRVALSISAPDGLRAGDADQDFDFDQLDLVQVQVAAKYLTGAAATWGEGDWDGAPGGSQGSPPAGDGMFNQLDIVAAQQAGIYLTGPYAAVRPNGQAGDGQTSVVYNPTTGELGIDAPAGTELTSINIDSAAGIFTGDAAANLGGSFDNDSDVNIFKATFGSSFGALSFGNVAQTGLSEDFLLGDLTVVGSLAGGGDLGNVDLIYVPEPSAFVLAVLAFLLVASVFGAPRRSTN